MQLTTFHWIVIAFSIVVLMSLGYFYFKKEKFFFAAAPEFREQAVCKGVPGVDITVYKTTNSEFPFKKINTMNLSAIIDRLNRNVIAVKDLQKRENENLAERIAKSGNKNLNWPRDAMVQFRDLLRTIKRDFNNISTKCRNMTDVYQTNANVIIASKQEADFLNNLDNYLDTVLFPFMTRVKLDDDDDMNNVYSITVPQSFQEFNASNAAMNNYESNQTRQVLRVDDKLWNQFVDRLETFMNKYPEYGFVKYEFLLDY
jgi:energy-converting hydrogenase A subunit M